MHSRRRMSAPCGVGLAIAASAALIGSCKYFGARGPDIYLWASFKASSKSGAAAIRRALASTLSPEICARILYSLPSGTL